MVTKMKNNKNLEEEKIEWKKLWEVTIWNKKFAGVEKHKQPKINSCHHYFSKDLKKLVSEKGEIKILTTNFSNVFADEEEVKTNISEGEIICIPGGGNPIVQYYNGKFITGDNKIATSYDKNKLNNKYLYYYLIHNIKLISEMYRGGTIKHPDMTKILEIQIPLPPLKKQAEIAETLDKFTELTEELTAREAQYNYYRNMLLSQEWIEKEEGKEVEWKALEEVCKILNSKRKPITRKNRNEGIYPYYGANGIKSFVKDYIFNEVLILMGEDGSVMDKNKNPVLHWIENQKIWVNNHAHVLGQLNKKYNLKYIYYFLSTIDVSKIVKGLPPKLNQSNLRKIQIPIPSLKTQQKIIDILDKFEALVNDIRQGLPREIELRQKQYEYYREKLLTF